MEMTGCGKRGKPKAGFSCASHSPWKSLGDSHIPTAPAWRGKVENQKQVSHFPTATITLLPIQKIKGGSGLAFFARPCSQPQNNERSRSEALPAASNYTAFSGSSPIGIDRAFQARTALELILDFRLISGLENAVRRYSLNLNAF
jgi:hypothetical protein